MTLRRHTLAPFLVALMLISAGTGSASAQAAGPEEFYQSDAVQSVYLTVAEAELQRMLAALPNRIYVRAAFRWRDISLDNVAIRFKGNSSSSPSPQHKRSYLIKFDEYAEGQRFLGLRRASLDNGIQFGSLLSEPIITEILREHGVTTHRCNHAKLYVNDKYQGVYVNVERIDETFLERSLPDRNGLLFKVDEGGPGANLQFIGDDPAAYRHAFEADTKSAKRGWPQLVEFIRRLNQPPGKDFPADLEKVLEVDDFLRVTAVMLFSGAFDQLTGWNPHNYYLYCDSKTGRWRYLPWDLDVGFSEVAFGHVKVLADWNAAWPAPQPNPLLERIVSDPSLLRRYREISAVVLEKSFEPERLCARIDARYALIKADLAADPFPHRRITNPQDRSYEDIVVSMKDFVRKRYASARQQLENPGKRPAFAQMHPAGPNGPPPPVIAKIQRLMRAAEKIQATGGDVAPIQKLMQQVGPLLEQGRIDDAEKLVNEALKLAGEAPPK